MLVPLLALAYTITFTENATSDGVVDLFIADGRYNSTTRVAEGDTETEIATNVAAELNDIPGLPFDVVAAAGVVTLTAKNAGGVGNGMLPIYNWTQRRDHAPTGVVAEIDHAVTGLNAGAAAPLDYFSVLGECCYCCIAMLYDNPDWQDAMIAYIKDAWSCEKPQCFGHGYTYNYGPPGRSCNRYQSVEVLRLATVPMDPVVGWLKAAAYAV